MSKKSKPAPDVEAIKWHLRLIVGGHAYVVQTYPPKTNKAAGKPEHKYFRDVSDTAITYIAESSARGMNVGVVPNPMDGKGRKAENCTGIRWLFADFDSGTHKLDSVLQLPVKPNVVVETSGGRYHAYFRVEDCPVDKFSAVQKALAVAVGSDASVNDPSRCMRMAGTTNHNHEPPVIAQIVYPQKGRRNNKTQTLAEFRKAMDLPSKPDKNVSKSGLDVDALLETVNGDDREIWRKVGMALHSEWPNKKGYELWTRWSRQHKNFVADDQRLEWNKFKPDGGITIGTLVHLAKTDGKAADGETTIPSPDESEFAAAIAKVAEGQLGHDPKTKTWWRFTGVIWESSKGDHQALKFVREWLGELGREIDDSKALAKLRRVAVMSAALRQLQLDDRIIIDEAQFDVDPYLLGMANGVVDLRTCEFRAGRSEDRLTKRTAVVYDSKAKCPEFWAFLKAVTRQRRELAEYLLRGMGYTLTGAGKEHKLFMLLGTTRNGKGMLMNTFAELMGQLGVPVNPALLMGAYSRDPNAPASALMRIRGARLLICTELSKGKPFDEAFIKQLTGGDKLAGREGYGQQIEFGVNAKLWVSSNSDPEIAYGAEAMWARIAAIPFDVRFDGKNDDKMLREKLAAEGPGIMALLVKYAAKYLADGLPECREVVEATAKLRERLDTVKSWVDNNCREAENARIGSDDAYKSYSRHCRELHRAPLTRPGFRTTMALKGFEPRRRADANYFAGLRLLN